MMNTKCKEHAAWRSQMIKRTRQLVLVSCAALVLGGCLHDRQTKSGGFLIGSHPAERHPIMVARKPVKLALPVNRGDYAIGEQRAFVLKRYLHGYRSKGSGKLRVMAPTGTPNELAAFNVMEGVRSIIDREGIPLNAVEFRPYTPSGDPEAPIRISYLGYAAKAPECGDWSDDLTRHRKNLSYRNFGCATQANIAAMIANPKDLVEPRGMDARSAERRDVAWGKYIKGADTTSKSSGKQNSSKVGGNN